jgi:hypothetical protein
LIISRTSRDQARPSLGAVGANERRHSNLKRRAAARALGLFYYQLVLTTSDAAVLAANRAFYVAFNGRNIRAMEGCWAEKTPISCIHPGWAPLLGRQAVMASWRAIFGSAEPPRIEISDPHPVVLGATAFIVCTERLGEATIVATNLFVEEAGVWRLLHHHGGPTSTSRPSRRPGSTQMN